MPSQAYFDQQATIANLKGKMLDAMQESGERDIAIWIAVLTELLKRVSDWNLEADRNKADE